MVVCAMVGHSWGMVGLMEQITTGNAFSLMVASFQMNCGSKAASHGYPRKMSSLPMFVI